MTVLIVCTGIWLCTVLFLTYAYNLRCEEHQKEIERERTMRHEAEDQLSEALDVLFKHKITYQDRWHRQRDDRGGN